MYVIESINWAFTDNHSTKNNNNLWQKLISIYKLITLKWASYSNNSIEINNIKRKKNKIYEEKIANKTLKTFFCNGYWWLFINKLSFNNLNAIYINQNNKKKCAEAYRISKKQEWENIK